MSENEITNDDFDIDGDSTDVKELISYANPPNGTHIYGIRYCGLDELFNGIKGIRLIYQYLGTVEKSNPKDLDIPVGSLFAETFTGNKMGKELFKKRLLQIFGEEYKGGEWKKYIDSLQEQKMTNFHLQITTKITFSKGKGEKKDITYENVRFNAVTCVPPIELPQGFEPFDYEPKLED